MIYNIVTTIASFITLLSTQSVGQSFISMGDWGAAAIGGQHLDNVVAVSDQLSKTIKQTDSRFILNTGDNFYYCGIQNIHDRQVSTDFIQQFKDTQIDWYNSLGNHDYGYNVSAQIDLSSVIPNWIMDDRYYTRTIPIGTSKLYIVVIDTNPCNSWYVGEDKSKWDPCGSEYPTCSLHTTDDDFEGPCQFHENILSQNCSAQYQWFSQQLNSIQNKKRSQDWVIIIGHHPIYEIDMEPFATLIDKYADLYLNGHSHLLNQYSVNGKSKYVTTGAGGMVSVKTTTSEKNGKKILRSSHSYKTIWTQTVAGFTLHTLSNNGSSLTTDYIDWQGNVIHSFRIVK